MLPIKSPLYQTHQIREFERLAQERFDLSAALLMRRAGKAAFDFLTRRWPQAQKIAIFCGGGNNGGDGYVLAELAHERNLHVTVWQVGDHAQLKEPALQAQAVCQKMGVTMRPFNAKSQLEHPDLIVDAICGIGIHGALKEDAIIAIEKIHRTHAPVLALDIPTGIDADTGQLLGSAIRANATMTFIGLKIGLLTGSGIAHSGEVILSDLQLPADLFTSIEPMAEKIHLSSYSGFLKPRVRDWHKGLSGHVLVIGGDIGYSGAPRMAAQAALRIGAGLVTVATRPEYAAVLNVHCPEIMSHGVNNPQDLEPLLDRADVIVLGPGLGQSDWSMALWEMAIAAASPLVVDADALNLLSRHARQQTDWVLTPHVGEAARLLQQPIPIIQENRLAAANAIQTRYGGVCVLKGAGTLISASNMLPALCDKGNPGMATGGMGDVLSGVIGGLMAQGLPPRDAAKLGVYLHAAAADLAAKEGERGMIATDLLPYLRRLVNHTT